jgi:hypothetical protein
MGDMNAPCLARWSAAATAILVGAFASPARADCTKDTDCKGDRVCEQGRCVFPTSAPGDCTKDTDCKGDRVCVRGECRAPSPDSSAPAPAPASPAPSPKVTPPPSPPVDHGSTEPSPPSPSDDLPDRAPVHFGVSVDLGATAFVPSNQPLSVLLDTSLGLGVSGGHFGGSVDAHFGLGSWGYLQVEALGRFYLFDSKASPFVTAGFAPYLSVFPFSKNPSSKGQAADGQAVVFELGEEICRNSPGAMLRFKARVEVPFFSAKDESGQQPTFWMGALLLEGVITKAPDNFWML